MSAVTSGAGGAVAGAVTAGAAMFAMKEELENELRAGLQQSLDEARAQLAQDREELHTALESAKAEIAHAAEVALETLAAARAEAESALQHAVSEAISHLQGTGQAQETEAQDKLEVLAERLVALIQSTYDHALGDMAGRFEAFGHELADQANRVRGEMEQQLQSQVQDTESRLADVSRDVLVRVEDESRRHHADLSDLGDRVRRDLESEADHIREKKVRFRGVVEDIVQGFVEQAPVIGHSLSHLADRIDLSD